MPHHAGRGAETLRGIRILPNDIRIVGEVQVLRGPFGNGFAAEQSDLRRDKVISVARLNILLTSLFVADSDCRRVRLECYGGTINGPSDQGCEDCPSEADSDGAENQPAPMVENLEKRRKIQNGGGRIAPLSRLKPRPVGWIGCDRPLAFASYCYVGVHARQLRQLPLPI